ncbi:MAG: family 43 glycosylhydrolase [Prevotella sp.]|nr:family 43 glycosylhydrolase [Prevotella sp.]
MNNRQKLMTLLLALAPAVTMQAQTELTTSEAKSLVKNTTKKRVSIHDPSVVWEPTSQRYYIFGSHKVGAWTTDMQNWTQANPTWTSANSTAFSTPAVKKVKKGGEEVDFPQFDAREWSARTDANYNVNGNMWAPDVIWNEKMQKWCFYLSINGDAWHSSIILLTSNSITGPYQYQGPVVICGFYDSGHSYKDTDLELVLGTQTSLPTRYARTGTTGGQTWGDRWPHTIDPAVFYDEEGKLWLVYGSWSGGIWMLELDEETGLRDYDVTYPSTGGSANTVTSDPYYGKKVAGGLYVSGEDPYIEHIGQHYYLFVSYGGFAPDGGYEMRVFRSDKPDGPYKDASGRSAIFTSWVKNYADGTDTRGEKLMGAYNKWGYMTVGECAQGHNSIIAAQDGRTYLVYHTKFNDGTVGHQVRVHQVFLNENGWLVASPFEYNGGELTDEDVASRQLFNAEEMAGRYQVLIHKYKMDCAKMEEVTPISITLGADGTIAGDRTGTWSMTDGTSYLKLVMNGVTYNGVVIEQQMDSKSVKTVSFSAMANSGVDVWGYKMTPQYELATQLSGQSVPVTNGQYISQDVDLYAPMDLGLDNVVVSWKSSEPAIISDYGKYNPTGLQEAVPVTLTARAETPGWFWQEEYNVSAQPDNVPTGTWRDDMVAHYGFDTEELTNTLDGTQQAQLKRNSTTAAPVLADNEPMRVGKVVHLNFGANGKESYVEMPNPLKGKDLTEGATISFWVKRTDANLWDALFGVTDGTAHFYITGNSYVGFNNGDGDQNWIDLNHPSAIESDNITVGQWRLVTLTVASNAITLYVNGMRKAFSKVSGKAGDSDISSATAFNYQLALDLLSKADVICLGNGSFWGSANALFDDVIVYSRALKAADVLSLNRVENRVFDFGNITPDGISDVSASEAAATNAACFNLQGVKVASPKRGLYIVGGRKVVVR